MRGLVSRAPASTRSTQAGTTIRLKDSRGLGDVLGNVGNAIAGALDAAGNTVKGVGTAVGNIIDGVASTLHAIPPAIPTGGATGAASSGGASGGSIPTRPAPRPTDKPPASGGGQSPHPPPPVITQEPQPSQTRPSSESGEGTAPASTQPASSSTAGLATSAPITSTGLAGPPKKLNHQPAPIGLGDSQTGDGGPRSPGSTASAAPPSISGTLDDGGGAHGKSFPLAAIGAVLGVVVLSAILGAVWFYRRKRRRGALRAYPHPHYSKRRAMSLISATTVSTVPRFISAREAGVQDENPFTHPRDVTEDDPFDAASIWSASSRRSASTISV